MLCDDHRLKTAFFLCEFIIYCKLATGEYVQLLGGQAKDLPKLPESFPFKVTRMVSFPVSGKVFGAELSDPLRRSGHPDPLSQGVSAEPVAACNYQGGVKCKIRSKFPTSVSGKM